MKKTLLSLLCLAGTASLAFAADVTEDFNNWTTQVQDANNPQTVNSPNSGLKWTFTGSAYTSNPNYKPIYVMLKSGATAGAIATEINFEVTEIQITTPGSPSTNAGNTITVSIGDKAIETKYQINKANTTFKIPIAAANRVQSGTYKFQSDGSKNSQIAKIVFVGASAEPSISLITETLQFAAPANVAITKNVELAVENISDDINFTTTGEVFSGSGSIGASDVAEGFPVTMKSATAGTFTGETTVSAQGVTAKVTLSAIVVENEGTEANPLSVKDVLDLKNLYAETVYVKGIINDKTAANAKDGVITEAETPGNTNLILKDTEGSMIPVALPTGDAREILNIVSNPSNVGQTVVVKGSLETYFGAPGVKNTEYVSGLNGSSIEDLNSDAENTNAIYYNLQGARVDNPSNGVYIRVINNKAEKVVL